MRARIGKGNYRLNLAGYGGGKAAMPYKRGKKPIRRRQIPLGMPLDPQHEVAVAPFNGLNDPVVAFCCELETGRHGADGLVMR